MKKRFICAAIGLPLVLAGCGGLSMPSSLWPFGEERGTERSRVPPNSVTYQCAAGKRFYLRYLDNGAAAWVILPEREFRLDKVAGNAGRFGNGKTELSVNGDEATLSEGPTPTYTGCKIPVAAPAPEKK